MHQANGNPLVPTWVDIVWPLGLISLLFAVIAFIGLLVTEQDRRTLLIWLVVLALVPFSGVAWIWRYARSRRRANHPNLTDA